MNHIDKKLLQAIKNGVDTEQNLPVYTTQMMHLEYEYSVIMASLHYYTLAEVLLEDRDALTEDFLTLSDDLQTVIADGIVADVKADNADCLSRIDGIRKTIMEKMQVLTAYTDALQIYEYMLNRVEAGVLDMVTPVDIPKLCEELYRYIFKENDNMVINSKLQMVTAQLPMRMTKTKFYDTLGASLAIYNGSETANFEEFVSRIRSAVLLELPEGYGTLFPELYGTIRELDAYDYAKLSKEDYLKAQGILQDSAARINDIVTDYLMLTDVVNGMYAVLLAAPYSHVVSDALDTGMEIIRAVCAAVSEDGALTDAVDSLLVKLEGEQEQLMEELAGYEGVFYEVRMLTPTDKTVEDKLSVLEDILKLHSNSVFIDLAKEASDGTLADAEYIAEACRKLEAEFDTLFENSSRLKKRAIMAAVVAQLPVIFNNTQEIQNYISYTLTSCSNDSELTAVAGIFEDMMTE